MIKNIFYLFPTLIILSCSTDGFKIKGSVDLKDGNMIYLNIADANQQPLVIDSSAIVDGAFEMSGKVKSPDINLLESIVSEAFMPISYGGGIASVDQADELFKIGIEKIFLNVSTLNLNAMPS